MIISFNDYMILKISIKTIPCVFNLTIMNKKLQLNCRINDGENYYLWLKNVQLNKKFTEINLKFKNTFL